MFELHGKYGKAKIYASIIEQEAISQIQAILNHPISQNANIRIMPDVHAGKGCVIGYTARFNDYVIPNLIGVDIGCGVLSVVFSKKFLPKFKDLDSFIKESIPSGCAVHDTPARGYELAKKVFDHVLLMKNVGVKKVLKDIFSFKEMVRRAVSSTGQESEYVWASVGTLGGGNHFIEIEEGKEFCYLTIHSGSRNFGLKIANFYQKKAEELRRKNRVSPEEIRKIREKYSGKEIEKQIKLLYESYRIPKGLEYFYEKEARDYIRDMKTAQIFAQVNRRAIVLQIFNEFKIPIYPNSVIESIHNYINFEDGIIRKGAISAHKGEKVVIPMHMAFGVVIGIGKGNPEWNFSAPHGAGRRLSRSKAKRMLNVEDFERELKEKGVWSQSISYATLDEAPGAYKPPEKVIEYLKETVDIIEIAKPIYNFKAGEEIKRKNENKKENKIKTGKLLKVK